MTAEKLPVCGKAFPDGTCVDGMIEAEDTRLVRRCECRYRQLTGAEARDAGMNAAAEANPQAMKAALAIIREAALANPTMNANTVRSRMKIAQIPSAVVGKAFAQAVKDHVLRPIGYIPSTDPGTHMHPVRDYESRIYRPAAGRAAS